MRLAWVSDPAEPVVVTETSSAVKTVMLAVRLTTPSPTWRCSGSDLFDRDVDEFLGRSVSDPLAADPLAGQGYQGYLFGEGRSSLLAALEVGGALHGLDCRAGVKGKSIRM